MIIDINNGDVFFSELKVSKEMKLQLLIDGKYGVEIEDEIINGWQHLFLKNMTLNRRNSNVKLIFSPKGNLEFVIISFLHDKKVNWKEYSLSYEKDKEMMNDDFLMRIVGDKSKVFSWGRIESSLDSRNGDATITIRYSS